MKRLLTLRLTLVSFLFFIGLARSEAAPGDLDPNFGGFGTGGKIQDLGFTANAVAIDAQGRLVLAGGAGGSFHVQRRSGPRFLTTEDVHIDIDSKQVGAFAQAVAIAPDGKIVVVGTLVFSGDQLDFAVARLNPDLTLDTSFAGDGTKSSDFDGLRDEAFAVAVQSDNKIVVAGRATIGGLDQPSGHFGVERFNENGTLDSSFNGNGKWSDFDTGSFTDGANAIVMQGDGKILVAGPVTSGLFNFNTDFATVRLNPDGSPDSTFGVRGKVVTDFGFNFDYPYCISLAPDGKIIVAGDASDSIGIARYLPNGAPDSTFGGDGRVTAVVNGDAVASSAVVQPDGKVVVAGYNTVTGQPRQFLLLRYNIDGSPDPAFGTAGQVFTSFGVDAAALALALQSDGMLVAVGEAQAARYRSDGSLDAGGIAQLVFDPTHIGSEATALAVQNDGQLLAAGKVFTTDYDMAVARFTSDRHGLDVTFGTDTPRSGRTLYRFFHEAEEVRAAALGPDGKLVVAGKLGTATQGDNMMIGRFNTDGTADNDCALKGFNDVDFGGSDDEATALAIAGSKTYLAGTVRGPTNNDYGLVRFANNCSVDSTGGPQLSQFKLRIDLGGDESVGGIVLDANGRPVLAGTSNKSITLIRVRTDNLGRPQIDGGFGTAGRATLPAGTLPVGTTAVVTGLATQSDGKLIVSGSATFPNGQTHFVVARFSAEGQLDASFGVRSPGFNMMDTANALAVRSDDTIAVAGSTQTSAGTVFALAQFTADGRVDTGFNGTGQATLRLGPDGEDVAQAVTFVGANHVVVAGYSAVFGIRQFALAALETTRTQPAASCVGDCNGDGSVTVDDLLTMVNIALGTADVSACEAGDANGDGQITIDEILSAVNVALTSCPAA